MILQMPSHFDKNEWFILLSITLIVITIYFLPKHFQFVQVLFIWAFNIYLGEAVDLSIAPSPFDLYDINDTKKYEIFDLILYFSLYPSAVYIFLTIYENFKVLKKHLISYIIITAVITTGLEWVSNQMGVFHYNHWSIYYSLPVYIVVYVINLNLYLFVKRHLKLNNKNVYNLKGNN